LIEKGAGDENDVVKEDVDVDEDDIMKDGVDDDNETLTKDTFKPGNIHREKFFTYWREELEASPWVLNLLEQGYKIPFKAIPKEYEEQNNATARAEPDVVEKIVLEMIEIGIIEEVNQKPHCVSPLGLVKKKLEDGSMKYRLVFDASRCINLFLEEKHVSLMHLEKALEMTEKDDYQSIFDLTSCYYHVKIYEPHQKFLGASCQLRGRKIYFQYKHLPFGLASAVHVITKIMKPIIAKVQSCGIKFSIYIDDGRFLALNQSQANKFRKKIYEILDNSGWQVSKEKSDGENQADKIKKYLGFMINTRDMRVYADTQKLSKVKDLIINAIEKVVVPVKHLAKILGNIVALIPSHGFAARVASKSGYALIESHTSQFGWQGQVCVDEATKSEWKFFLEAIDKSNGMPIRSQLNDIRVDMIIENPITKQVWASNHDSEGREIWISDASAFKVVAFNLENKQKEMLSILLTEEEKSRSSGYRELLAIQKTVKTWKKNDVRKKHVYWCTDSTNVVSFMSKGSSKKHLQEIIFEVACDLQKLDTIITPIHLLREDPRIGMADELSKTKDSDDWSIDEMSFQELDRVFKFTVDVFASEENKRVSNFFSQYMEPSSRGVDAFTQDWSQGTLWICPPVKFLIKIAIKIRKIEAEGVIVLPNWITSSFYNFYFDASKKPREPFLEVKRWKPFVYQNQGADGPLKGKLEFDLIALYFDTKKGLFRPCGE